MTPYVWKRGDLYHVEVHVVDLLMGDTPIVLQDVVVGCAGGGDDLLERGLDAGKPSHVAIAQGPTYENLGQRVIGDISELGAVELGDHKLEESARCLGVSEDVQRGLWPEDLCRGRRGSFRSRRA